MSLAPPKPGQERIMSFREGLKLKAYQETIDYIKKRIKTLEPCYPPPAAEDAARLEVYHELLVMLEYGGGLGNIY